jgi:hypothetical protein
MGVNTPLPEGIATPKVQIEECNHQRHRSKRASYETLRLHVPLIRIFPRVWPYRESVSISGCVAIDNGDND